MRRASSHWAPVNSRAESSLGYIRHPISEEAK